MLVGNAFNSSDVLKNACIDFVAFDAVCEASRPCFRAECLFFVGGVVDSSLNISYSTNLTYKIFPEWEKSLSQYLNIFFLYNLIKAKKEIHKNVFENSRFVAVFGETIN